MTLADWKPQDWIALAAVLASIATSGLALFFSQRREARQQARDDELRQQQQARDDELRRQQQAREDNLLKIERVHIPQIEFSIDCKFHGPQRDWYIVEVLLTVRNRGRVKQEFHQVTLRIRGIEQDQALSYWKGRGATTQFSG